MAALTGSSKGIPNAVDIHRRPEVANRRERLGDWEANSRHHDWPRTQGRASHGGRKQIQATSYRYQRQTEL
ncbi:hypothetical protein SAMN05421863_102430 [Nitrosomonas communis]|uniref:Uncharacterized protein n=2 Tax=Nitrosomonas communis TaxID=44574 RepID=A0A1I4Q2J9_9PROT|nr:hypothetical protein SAMN05421863_102430 [Nitrosomonas communis]